MPDDVPAFSFAPERHAMEFAFDPKKYRIIDISHTVIPGENPDRPFTVQKAIIPGDHTFRYDVHLTHTHVGTHVEMPKHFFEQGKCITDYPLDYFHGRAVLLSVTEKRTTGEFCQRQIGGIIRPDDIVVVRNDTGTKLTKEMVYSGDFAHLPTLTLSAAEFFIQSRVRMLVLDYVRLGETVDLTRKFHDMLMSRDMCFVEIVENLESIKKLVFYVMVLPYKVLGMDSGWTRAIVIEEVA
jgi:arylformamidase